MGSDPIEGDQNAFGGRFTVRSARRAASLTPFRFKGAIENYFLCGRGCNDWIWFSVLDTRPFRWRGLI